MAGTPPFHQLSDLLVAGRPAHTLVAFGSGGDRDWADFERRVAALCSQIRRAGGEGSGRWLVYSEDAYACAVSIFALARAGAQAVLTPNAGEGTLRRLRSDVVGALVDPGVGVADSVGEEALSGLTQLAPLARAPRSPDASDAEPRALERGASFAEFFTSGTTGSGKSVPKLLRHLDDEVAALEACFGDSLHPDPGAPPARVFATVSHQHVYGLLHRVLWPLAAGRPFCSDTFLHAGELLPRMARAEASVLVSTPTHLRRLHASEDFARLRSACRAVFSSGGLLEESDALAVEAALGAAPIEVLGSTETGGVARRRRRADDPDSGLWRPFEAVTVEAASSDERLVVTSPFVSLGEELRAEGPSRFHMGDRVAFEAGKASGPPRFRLLGRADREVKIGENRLSLPDMEGRLRAHPWVAEAALVVLEQTGEPRVHAAVVPSEAGWRALHERERRLVGRELAEHLAADWQRVLLPRAWRYLEELPRDPQAKVTVDRLAALFGPAQDGDEGAREATRPRMAECLSEQRDGSRLRRRLRVPPDLVYLEGHFEGFPIVPGVVQLAWALEGGETLLGRRPVVRVIEALKFKEVLLPGQVFELYVELEGERLRFRLEEDSRLFSSGRCILDSRRRSS